MNPVRLLPDLFCFRDTCNVYVWRDGDEASAIDFGSGRWLPALRQLGVRQLTHVFLTHHHADQCAGLLARRRWPFLIHAPGGEDKFLAPDQVKRFWRERLAPGGYPASYSVLPRGVPHIRYNLAGYGHYYWGQRRIRFLLTPGHGPYAVSIIINVNGRQVVFCGDAAHAGATIWQPYHLEWDHWTGTGALAAWEGVQRLSHLGIDLLCPSHGPVISANPRAALRQLAARLLKFYRAKGGICPGEREDYVVPDFLPSGAARLRPHLVQFGANSYLLASKSGEALVVDPMAADLIKVNTVLRELGGLRLTGAVATHYHLDHSDGLPVARQKYGAKIWLHPQVAEPLRRIDPRQYPYLPTQAVQPDGLWPTRGRWQWNEYVFDVALFPGQTWWHAAFQTRVDGCRVLFGGDNFQPSSRWNGTGGFSAFNGSRFAGFVRSAQLVLQWRPDILACGHQTYYRFHPRQFRKIVAWAKRAEAATRALCPTGNLDRDYYLHKQP